MNPTDHPPIVERPKLALWMFERNLKLKDAVQPIGVQFEQVRRYCLPFTDPARAVPTPGPMERIIAWTRGEVTPTDFYPPHIRGDDPAVAEAVQP